MYNRLDRISACDTQTDRETDGRTVGRTDILLRHSPRYAYASRGNEHNKTNFQKKSMWDTPGLTVNGGIDGTYSGRGK